ncbi:MAG: ABC transporter ATP-binding protein [Lachnospirales bacterium]
MLFETKDIIREYKSGEGKLLALNKVNVVIEEGEITTILGPSGSGKTTLLNNLSGLDKINSGEILFQGQDIAKFNQDKLTTYRRENTGFIFQNYNLVSTLTARENVALGAYLSDNALDVDEIIKEVGLEEHGNKFPHQLSGGQQQRIAIARVLVKNPKVIFCDEPTGALDEESGRVVLQLLQNLNKKYKTSIIMVTHNPNIANMSHKVIYFKNGKIDKVMNNESIVDAFSIDWS